MTTIREALVQDETIDEYFPKGDKRRGKVLVVIAKLSIAVEKVTAERIAKFRNLTLNSHNIHQRFIGIGDFNSRVNELEFDLGLAKEEKP